MTVLRIRARDLMTEHRGTHAVHMEERCPDRPCMDPDSRFYRDGGGVAQSFHLRAGSCNHRLPSTRDRDPDA
jgi:hypothetical protein